MLVKDPKVRLRDIGDAALELREIGSTGIDDDGPRVLETPVAKAPRWMWPVVVAVAALGAGMATISLFV